MQVEMRCHLLVLVLFSLRACWAFNLNRPQPSALVQGGRRGGRRRAPLSPSLPSGRAFTREADRSRWRGVGDGKTVSADPLQSTVLYHDCGHDHGSDDHWHRHDEECEVDDAECHASFGERVRTYLKRVGRSFSVLRVLGSLAFAPGMRTKQTLTFSLMFLVMLISKWMNVRASLMTGEIVSTIQKAGTEGIAAVGGDPRGLVFVYGMTALAGKLLDPVAKLIYMFGSMRTQRAFTGTLFGKFLLMDAAFHAHTTVAEQETEYDRAVAGLSSVLDGAIRLALPMLVELSLVIYALGSKYGSGYALQTLFTVVPYIVFTWVAGKNRAEVQKRKNAAENEASKKFYESVSNQETVKLFSKEAEEKKGYVILINDYLNKLWRVMAEWQILNGGQFLILVLGMCSIYLSVFSQLLSGGIAVGDVVAITALFGQLSNPLHIAGWMLQSIMTGFVDMERSLSILDRNPTIRDLPGSVPMVLSGAGKKRGPTVRLEGVSFGYEVPPSSSSSGGSKGEGKGGEKEKEKATRREILRNATVEIPSGQTVALVGGSGGGKSTIIKLIARLYDPDSGRVTVDDQDVKHVTLESLRHQMAVVQQDVQLFEDTIFNNVLYGDPKRSPAEVEAAVRAAGLGSLIERLPNGLQTMVGEKGVTLSGGERQRITIARAVLRDAPLMLCDEITSAVDALTEREIMDSLMQVARGRTTVLIAHRLTSVVGADKIVVIGHGGVMEEGTFDELMSMEGGEFARMWNRQLRIDKRHQEAVDDDAEEADEFGEDEKENEQEGASGGSREGEGKEDYRESRSLSSFSSSAAAVVEKGSSDVFIEGGVPSEGVEVDGNKNVPRRPSSVDTFLPSLEDPLGFLEESSHQSPDQGGGDEGSRGAQSSSSQPISSHLSLNLPSERPTDKSENTPVGI
uniref:ABC transporter domain-containing protein n=1 Tax=Chromera velia CCMP2878 TaxID=1169474 RepID=A0A0G4H4C8_9ALVE|eukprot:Cvel_24651.t1-p1 / transcript=Cvel_24651.t1 / gene=Cvel_24651 / organism=Chromera_velia_CCMP2878 / gene_product=ABC transporter B family member 5, putative / transcript_product=ABC transporter B family member 5, putative / location=Cvel_scaffold2693:19671-22394(+) / protein_length=908 / sequence_SO=supercontig / SO=protein_coding / is_pseudo=false